LSALAYVRRTVLVRYEYSVLIRAQCQILPHIPPVVLAVSCLHDSIVALKQTAGAVRERGTAKGWEEGKSERERDDGASQTGWGPKREWKSKETTNKNQLVCGHELHATAYEHALISSKPFKPLFSGDWLTGFRLDRMRSTAHVRHAERTM